MQFVQEESVATALLLNGVEPGQDDTTFLALHGNHLCVEKSKYPAAAPQKEKKPEVYVVFNSVIFLCGLDLSLRVRVLLHSSQETYVLNKTR